MNRKNYLTLLFGCASLILSGCVAIPAKKTAHNANISWPKRQQQLAKLQNWRINGGFALKQGKEGVNVRFQWQQQPHRYNLRFYGPLASGQVVVKGSDHRVTLIDEKTRRHHANNAESLLQQQTGWRLPIENLVYWIRGLPAPGKAATKHLDQYNHLAQLRQQGWSIVFQRYTAVNGVDLPSKIRLDNKDFRIRIIVSNWQV